MPGSPGGRVAPLAARGCARLPQRARRGQEQLSAPHESLQHWCARPGQRLLRQDTGVEGAWHETSLFASVRPTRICHPPGTLEVRRRTFWCCGGRTHPCVAGLHARRGACHLPASVAPAAVINPLHGGLLSYITGTRGRAAQYKASQIATPGNGPAHPGRDQRCRACAPPLRGSVFGR